MKNITLQTEPLIYVAGPYSGTNGWIVELNIRQAEERAYRIARQGGSPICPHSMTRFFNGTLTYERWIQITLNMLTGCDACEVDLKNWYDSPGTRGEVEFSKDHGIPVLSKPQQTQDFIDAWKAKHLG